MGQGSKSTPLSIIRLAATAILLGAFSGSANAEEFIGIKGLHLNEPDFSAACVFVGMRGPHYEKPKQNQQFAFKGMPGPHLGHDLPIATVQIANNQTSSN